MKDKEKITLVGFGWGSIGFLQYINTNKYDVHLISDNLSFLYTPLLAQNINNNRNLEIHAKKMNKKFTCVQDKVNTVDFKNNILKCDHSEAKFDHLIFAHGSSVNTFNIPGVEENTYFLKTTNHLEVLKEKINELKDGSHIVVIGCGLTGSELIGTLNDIGKFNITAIDALPRPLMMFNESLSNKALSLWKKQNVIPYFNSLVTKIDQKSLILKPNNKINFDLAIWCGGIKANDLTLHVNKSLNDTNNKGIQVNKYLEIDNMNNIYALGDCALTGNPPTAQVAYQQGIYLAKKMNTGKKEEFVFKNRGQIGYIGNHESVFQNDYISGGGKVMYILNNFIHLYNFGKIYIRSK